MTVRARPGVADALVVLGAFAIVYGVTLLSIAAGWICAGILLALVGLLAARVYG